jgi:Tfp pilus assembly protein PilV
VTSQADGETRAQQGASFLELMLAVLVIGVVLVAASASQLGTLQVRAATGPSAEPAQMLAREIHQVALRLPWSTATDAPPLFDGDVAVLSDLDGRVVSPPRTGADTALEAYEDWSQVVSVRAVDPDQPTEPAQPGQAPLTELCVSIRQGGQEVGQFSWWLARPGGD